MQLIYNLLNSRWKLPLILVCAVFNVILLLYIARPSTNIVIEEEHPKQSFYQHTKYTHKSAGTEPTQKPDKDKLIVKGPLTFMRHFASKVNSLRSVHVMQKENVSISTTSVEGDTTADKLEKKMQSTMTHTTVSESHDNIHKNEDVDDDIRPLVENLASRLLLSKKNDFDLKYLVNPVKMCQKDTYLLIAVCSAVQRVDYRAAIRETWGSVVRKRHLGVQLVFAVGMPDQENAHFQSAIQTESDTFHDILQINQVDHSRNLSFKTIGLFHWISEFCENATFVMKTDDDIFVNTRDLLREVKDLSTRSKVIMGHVIKGAQPITDRNDPWYNPPQIYKDKTYPDYLSGSAYLFPSSLIPLLLASSKTSPVFWLEDIYITGILAKSAQISLLNNPHFIYLKPEIMFDFCKYSKVQVVHGISSEEIKKFWKAINNLNC